MLMMRLDATSSKAAMVVLSGVVSATIASTKFWGADEYSKVEAGAACARPCRLASSCEKTSASKSVVLSDERSRPISWVHIGRVGVAKAMALALRVAWAVGSGVCRSSVGVSGEFPRVRRMVLMLSWMVDTSESPVGGD